VPRERAAPRACANVRPPAAWPTFLGACETRRLSPKSGALEPPEISVRPFRREEWASYRELRLRALADAPDAFGSTFERESAWPDQHWVERLATATDSKLQFPLVAELQGEPVGLALGFIDSAEPELAHVFQMWVAPHARGRGCGTALLQALSEWALSTTAKAMTLCVTCGNGSAQRLYAHADFKPNGDPEPLRPGSTVLVQPMLRQLYWV